MRFARISSAFVLLALLLTPARYLLRLLVSEPSIGERHLRSLGWGLLYLGLLLLLYGVVWGALWLIRRALLYAEAWTQFGLADFDIGVRGVWPFRWFFVLGPLLIVLAAVSGGGVLDLAEAVAACVVVFLALLGPAPEPNPVDEYDPLPLPQPYPTPTPLPRPPDESVVTLRMAWYFRREPGDLCQPPMAYQIQIDASRQRYEEFVAKDHTVAGAADYGRFVRDGFSQEVIDTVKELRRISERDRLGIIAEINNVLAFAQRFRYAHDREEKGVSEYPKYPLETMVEDRGDCEDHAILACACLLRLGYDVRLVLLDYGPGPGHMALAVAGAEDAPDAFAIRDPGSGKMFYYCEATTDAGSRDLTAISFRMGEIPASDRRAKMELIVVS